MVPYNTMQGLKSIQTTTKKINKKNGCCAHCMHCYIIYTFVLHNSHIQINSGHIRSVSLTSGRLLGGRGDWPLAGTGSCSATAQAAQAARQAADVTAAAPSDERPSKASNGSKRKRVRYSKRKWDLNKPGKMDRTLGRNKSQTKVVCVYAAGKGKSFSGPYIHFTRCKAYPEKAPPFRTGGHQSIQRKFGLLLEPISVVLEKESRKGGVQK